MRVFCKEERIIIDFKSEKALLSYYEKEEIERANKMGLLIKSEPFDKSIKYNKTTDKIMSLFCGCPIKEIKKATRQPMARIMEVE